MMLPARPPTPLHILYGSQTGCAQEVAERLHREAERRFFAPRTMAMDDYDIRALAEEPLVIFVVATTGEGDPPDNMRSFWRFLLRKGLPRDSLTSLSFAVFGLGDSSYEKFNAAARRLDVRLEQLGARRFLAIGGADDQSPKGMEADVDEWCTRMWATLLLSHGLPAGYKVDDRPRMPILGYALREVSVAAAVEAEPEAATSRPGSDRSGSTPGTAAAAVAAAVAAAAPSAPAQAPAVVSRADSLHKHCPAPAGARAVAAGKGRPSDAMVATVRTNARLTAEDWTQDVRHLELEVGHHCRAPPADGGVLGDDPMESGAERKEGKGGGTKGKEGTGGAERKEGRIEGGGAGGGGTGGGWVSLLAATDHELKGSRQDWG